MAEVVVAASSGEDAQARGLADALEAIGFNVGARAASETEIARLAEEAKCVVVLWTGAAPPAWLAVLATLAMDRKKLVCVEAHSGATPAPFQAAPRADLAARDRTVFKARFGALLTEIDKLAPTTANVAAADQAVAKARAAMLWKPRRPGDRTWMTFAAFGVVVAMLFAVGFGAGRVMNAARSGPPSPPAAAPAPVVQAAAQPTAAPAATSSFGVTPAQLEMLPWRDSAARIDAAA